jgi:hypothetical protein
MWVIGLFLAGTSMGCGKDGGSSFVKIMNDFNNAKMASQPPWTLCKTSYLGVDFGKIGLGETSAEYVVQPGLDYVLTVASWKDPSCGAATRLPVASRLEEEVVDGHSRTIAINLANHQGACPPTGVAPMPETLYNRILQLWPEFNFKPYADRTKNTKCL